MLNGLDLERRTATGDLLVQVGPDGRVVWANGAQVDGPGEDSTGLPRPAQGAALAEWLAAAAPIVLVVRRNPGGAGLLLAVRQPGTSSGMPPGERGGAPRTGGTPRRLVGFKRKRTFLFDPARVLAFELRSGLVHASFEDGESYTTNYSIRALAARLAPIGFFRVHRDVIVNLKRVKEIERIGQGRVRLLLDTPEAPGFAASRPASARLRRLLRF